MNMNLEWPQSIEKDSDLTSWLEAVVFPGDGFEPNVFPESHTLYEVPIHQSLLEDVIHRGVPPAGFTESQLSNAIRRAAIETCGHDRTKWFHVNFHDGEFRVVENVGQYSYDYPMVPLYILLNHNEAQEGGPTFAGLFSATKEWLVLLERSLHISIHGTQRFVESVKSQLSSIAAG